MNPDAFVDWARSLVEGFAKAGEWLSTPLSEHGLAIGRLGELTPLALVGFSGIVAFLSVAIVKWFLS